MKNVSKRIFLFLKQFSLSTILGIAFGILLASPLVFGFTSPSQNPPAANTASPITTGPEFQTKTGGISFQSVIAQKLQPLMGTLYLDETKGVNVSSTYSGSCCPWQHGYGASYAFSLSSIARLFAVPGDNCEVYLNGSSTGTPSNGIYSSSSGFPAMQSFRCTTPVNKLFDVVSLRAVGLKFFASGSDNSGAYSGDSLQKVQSFQSDFPGDFSGQVFLPGSSCTVKIVAASITGTANGYDSYGASGSSYTYIKPILQGVQFNGENLYTSSFPMGTQGSWWWCGGMGQPGKSGSYDQLDALWNTTIPTSFSGTKSGVSGGQKSLSASTSWIVKSQNNNSNCQNTFYSITSSASNVVFSMSQLPGIWNMTYAYECQP